MGNIKTYCWLVAVSLFCATHVVQAGPDSLAQFHFIGAKQLAGNTNAANLTKIWSTPLSRELVNRSVKKASVGLSQFLSNHLGVSANNPELISPLLDDILTFESMMDSKRGAKGSAEIVLAISLSEDRAKIWNDNLEKLLGTKGSPIKGDGFIGWEVKRKANPALIRFARAGQWVLVGSGEGELGLYSTMLESVKKSGRIPEIPEKLWLHADLDFLKLQAAFPQLANSPLKLARTELKVSGKNDYLRTTIRAVYPERLKWKAEKWNIPVSLVRDPIISFTAFQNLTALVKSPKEFNKLGVDPLEGQTFIWAQSGSPFHTHAAHFTTDAKKDFDLLARRLPDVYGAQLNERNAGKFILSTNGQEILWTGMPIIVPFVRATNTSSGSFLFGGLFPPLPLTNPPPSELITQITGQENLIYYDWELTQERLGEWQILSQLLPFSNTPTNPAPSRDQTRSPANSRGGGTADRKLKGLAQNWIAEVGPNLGNTATEINVTGPNEVSFVRRSNIGFTSFELLMLSTWLTDSDFKSAAPLPPANNSSKPAK